MGHAFFSSIQWKGTSSLVKNRTAQGLSSSNGQFTDLWSDMQAMHLIFPWRQEIPSVLKQGSQSVPASGGARSPRDRTREDGKCSCLKLERKKKRAMFCFVFFYPKRHEIQGTGSCCLSRAGLQCKNNFGSLVM